ncbi:MAG: hypothetical protein ACK4FS_04175 [Flavobacterium sp.]
MKKYLFHLSLYLGLFLFVLNLISWIGFKGLERGCFYKQQFIQNGVSETDFDYVILGSSTGLTTLNTILIDSLTGLNGLNISLDDSSLNSHYTMLCYFLSLGKTTKNLVLAITPTDMSESLPSLNSNDYRFLPNIDSPFIQKYFAEIHGTQINKHNASMWFPLVGMSYYNTELFYPSLLAWWNPEMRNRFDVYGNYSYPNGSSSFQKGHNYKFNEIVVNVNNPYFEKIKQMCFKNNVNLILYQSPIYNQKVTYPLELEVINHSDFLTEINYFYDRIHVNKIGREKCSIEFSKLMLP